MGNLTCKKHLLNNPPHVTNDNAMDIFRNNDIILSVDILMLYCNKVINIITIITNRNRIMDENLAMKNTYNISEKK